MHHHTAWSIKLTMWPCWVMYYENYYSIFSSSLTVSVFFSTLIVVVYTQSLPKYTYYFLGSRYILKFSVLDTTVICELWKLLYFNHLSCWLKQNVRWSVTLRYKYYGCCFNGGEKFIFFIPKRLCSTKPNLRIPK